MMKPPTELHTDYVQPPENISLKSPLELLANACNKLETDMMSGSNKSSPGLHEAARKLPSPQPTTSTHLPQLRLPPTRHTSEPISLVTRPSVTNSVSTRPSSMITSEPSSFRMSPDLLRQKMSPQSSDALRQRMSPQSSESTRQAASPETFEPQTRKSPEPQRQRMSPQSSVPLPQSTSDPISLVTKPKLSEVSDIPQNLSKRSSPDSEQPGDRLMPHRAEIGGLKVRPAEALSPAAQPMLKKMRESPSPRLTNRPSSSPSQSSSSPRPNIPGMPGANGLPHGFPHGFPPGAASSIPGMPPGFPYGPYMSLPGSAPPPQSAPCTDPMCRDPSCPTFQLRSAQAQLLAMSGMGLGMPGSSMPPGYPYSLPPGLGGMPGSMQGGMPAFPFGLQSALSGVPSPSHPGMLPPSFLQGLPPTCIPQSLAQPSAAITNSSPSLSVGTSPYMCSWMQGRDFCGRRFNSSEELMSHLRTHTANMGDAPPSLPQPPTSALALLQAQAAQLRGQISPPTSTTQSSLPMPPAASDPRYHPYYSRPSFAVPSTMSGSPLPPHLTMTNPMLASLYGSPRQLPVLP